MDSFLDLCRARRSCRNFQNTPVAVEALDRCLEAARLAPSACNAQPWLFHVAGPGPAKTGLDQGAFRGAYKMNAFAADAPVIIAVERRRGKILPRLGGRIRGTEYSVLDLGIACEHLVLQAAEEGLASCWIGWFDGKAAGEALGLGPRRRLELLIAIGYAASDPAPLKRRTIEEIRELH
ncbi:nitroreductase family protein [Kiritimatiella glycovorans]|uniref:NAD(P)H nitroreductase n=1 Tax=Kiritimatiella glycovorans TaxID=1307763 RepID=A0A0G3EDI1_9BACT|nr:nitroreductase family protein [Kiritimatiella glycovorans]AKJ64373.1 Putative NAD(P)H nitroreductase [Kiritimatiella glycovorans]